MARSSPSILLFILEQIGGKDLAEAFGLLANRDSGDDREFKTPQEGVIYTDKFVSINVNIPSSVIEKLNKRQLWFLGLLQQNQNVKAEDIATAWQINMRSAWRDITSLSNLGLIQFLGAKRTGKYRLLDYKPHN